ncbi:antibiotic biosynthesis monooxygenase family protein [Sorangium sp. So ce406]|uniref:antibiotic biosynthesis monooxygenase family protein n=1 Tax=Sorangium sp. So ce406 TaxID=3133311 RepID=UPI003F5BC4DF
MMNGLLLKRVAVGLGMLAAMAAGGCADDGASSAGDGTAGGPNGDGGAPPGASFDGCSKAELEPDREGGLELAGPGVDAGTGALKPGSYLVSTTYLAMKPEMAQKMIELSGPVMESLSTMKGFVAVAATSSSSCAAVRTLTVWESEQDMYAFVGSPAHARAMGHASSISRGTSNVISWEGSEREATWEEAAKRLGGEAGGDI